MNEPIDQQIFNLELEASNLRKDIEKAQSRLKEVKKKLRSIESIEKARAKKLTKLLGES